MANHSNRSILFWWRWNSEEWCAAGTYWTRRTCENVRGRKRVVYGKKKRCAPTYTCIHTCMHVWLAWQCNRLQLVSRSSWKYSQGTHLLRRYCLSREYLDSTVIARDRCTSAIALLYCVIIYSHWNIGTFVSLCCEMKPPGVINKTNPSICAKCKKYIRKVGGYTKTVDEENISFIRSSLGAHFKVGDKLCDKCRRYVPGRSKLNITVKRSRWVSLINHCFKILITTSGIGFQGKKYK